MRTKELLRRANWVVVIATGLVALHASQAAGMSAPNASSVLILGDSVTGGLSSNEATRATALGYTPVVVDNATWAATTAAEFHSYRALILGDDTCSGLSAVSAAVTNRAVWSAVVDGNVAINGTDPVYHQSQGGLQMTESFIAFAAAETGKTGLYVSLSCYYHDTSANTPVPLLDQFGTFTVTGVGCYNNAHIVALHPALAGMTDASLSNWSCSVHEAFDSYPANFLPLVIANGVAQGAVSFPDGSSGPPYALARGVDLTPVECGNGDLQLGEECDDGNTTNGDGCSAQCKVEACGNARVDFGEQCDDGNTTSGDGCSEGCQNEGGEGVCGDGVVDTGEDCDGTECCTADCDYAPADSSCLDDGNACTDDVCDGGGTCTHPADDSNTCDDDDLCTTSDSCEAGSCVGDEVECEAIDQCHAPGTCDSGTGECSAGPGISCTISGDKDSFLRVSNDNTNEGANPLLRLSGAGPGRPIVSFDLSGIDLVGVSSARLVFTVAENGGGWGSTGRTLDAYPVLSAFTEGNGRQVGLPPAQSTRGTGAGVTFSCASDANVANSKADCAPEWSGGVLGTKSSSVNHTNQTSGDVGFNVTADVLAGRHAWLVRKTNEGLTGRVDYFSREGAGAAGDPGIAPRLELEY